MANNVMVISPADNVAVALAPIKAGEPVTGAGLRLAARADIPKNHKVAISAIPANQSVIKYGEPIGLARTDIAPGDWVHTQNLKGEGE
jgi:altronate hydrolase